MKLPVSPDWSSVRTLTGTATTIGDSGSPSWSSSHRLNAVVHSAMTMSLTVIE